MQRQFNNIPSCSEKDMNLIKYLLVPLTYVALTSKHVDVQNDTNNKSIFDILNNYFKVGVEKPRKMKSCDDMCPIEYASLRCVRKKSMMKLANKLIRKNKKKCAVPKYQGGIFEPYSITNFIMSYIIKL